MGIFSVRVPAECAARRHHRARRPELSLVLGQGACKAALCWWGGYDV